MVGIYLCLFRCVPAGIALSFRTTKPKTTKAPKATPKPTEAPKATEPPATEPPATEPPVTDASADEKVE